MGKKIFWRFAIVWPTQGKNRERSLKQLSLSFGSFYMENSDKITTHPLFSTALGKIFG